MLSGEPRNADLAVGEAVGVGLGEAVGVRLGVAVGVGLGVAVGVCLGVAVGVRLGVAVGVCLGVAVGVCLGVAVGVGRVLTVGLIVGAAVGGPGGMETGGELRNRSNAQIPAAASTAAHITAISHFRGRRSFRRGGGSEKPSSKNGSPPNAAKSSCCSSFGSILPAGESGIENSVFSSVGCLSSGGKNQSDTVFTPEYASMAAWRSFCCQKSNPPMFCPPDELPPRAEGRPDTPP